MQASIHTIGGFSAHADQTELLAWHSQIGARNTILVHVDEDVMKNFAKQLRNIQVMMPKLNETFDL